VGKGAPARSRDISLTRAFAHPTAATRVIAGLTRQSIILRKKIFAKKMDARVKPAHDGREQRLPIGVIARSGR
jgi:hypothetical protein